MLEPADIAVEEGAQVAHAIFEHRQPVDAGAEGEALPFVGVEAGVGDDPRVDHPGAEHLHPILGAADDPPAVFPRPADMDVGRRLGEREIARDHADRDVVALEEGLEEGLQRPLQMAKVDRPVDHQPLDLVEHRRVGRVAVRAIDPPRRDQPQRRAMLLHCADLHRRGVGAQHPRLFTVGSRGSR